METAQQIAHEWIDAWNAHDLDAIMSHYADTIVIRSPIIVQRMGIANGKIEDKAQLRDYFARGLESQAAMHFTLVGLYLGVDSLTLRYQRHDGKEGAEMMAIDPETHQIVEVRAHYI